MGDTTAGQELELPERRLASRVYDTLLERIVRGELPPGTPMAELDLCRRLGVSRTPVREALIKLAEAGLVRILPKRGSYVAPISMSAFRDAQFIREHLECALVADAVRHMDATTMRELDALIVAQEQAARDGDGEAFFDQDEAFHAAIARLSGRPDVWAVVRQSKVQFDRLRLATLRDTSHIPLLVEQHREIAAGLAACSEAQAVAAMRRHLREIFHRAEHIIHEQQELAEKSPLLGVPR
jgi:DNA-binding GntR family transcriptional regulator